MSCRYGPLLFLINTDQIVFNVVVEKGDRTLVQCIYNTEDRTDMTYVSIQFVLRSKNQEVTD